MCGRYRAPGEQSDNDDPINLRLIFPDVCDMPPFEPDYNAAPTQRLPVYRVDRDRGPEIALLRWELIPSWAKDKAIGAKAINARGETLTEKPMFRAAFKSRRCLVPIVGFYEWQVRPEGKLPHYIFVRDEPIFTAAGLHEWWKSPEGEVVESFAIVTGEPNAVASDVHDRMPAIIDGPDRPAWLDAKTRTDELLALIAKPFPAERMAKYAVSSRVNSVRNNDAGLVEPLPFDPAAST